MTQTAQRSGWTQLHARGAWHYVQGTWTLCGLAAARSDLLLLTDAQMLFQHAGAIQCPKCQKAIEKAKKAVK